MASDSEWLEDVRRWTLGEAAPSALAAPGAALADMAQALPEDLGYEAAHPALQARHWPDALPGQS